MSAYRQRLLNVVRALRESPDPGQFTMDYWGHSCGTPACAMGHYAARVDLQDEFTLSPVGILRRNKDDRNEAGFCAISEHFGLDINDTIDMFGHAGCDGARTIDEAVSYIESYIERRWPLVNGVERLKKILSSIQEPVTEE